MSSRSRLRRVSCAAGLVILALGACAPVSSPAVSPPTVSRASPTGSAAGPTVRPSATAPVSTAAPADILPAASPSIPVQVLALGNVYIRRGPDLAFDPVGVLSKGAVVSATGRDVLSRWVRIALPEDSSQYGWVSISSEFTDVHGDLDSLLEIDPQEWPLLASLRNCTYHELWIEPAGLTLPPVYEFPNNDLRLNPGIYSVLDVDVEGYPEIMKADLQEGMTIEVRVDGLGQKKKCPPP